MGPRSIVCPGGPHRERASCPSASASYPLLFRVEKALAHASGPGARRGLLRWKGVCCVDALASEVERPPAPPRAFGRNSSIKRNFCLLARSCPSELDGLRHAAHLPAAAHKVNPEGPWEPSLKCRQPDQSTTPHRREPLPAIPPTHRLSRPPPIRLSLVQHGFPGTQGQRHPGPEGHADQDVGGTPCLPGAAPSPSTQPRDLAPSTRLDTTAAGCRW